MEESVLKYVKVFYIQGVLFLFQIVGDSLNVHILGDSSYQRIETVCTIILFSNIFNNRKYLTSGK